MLLLRVEAMVWLVAPTVLLREEWSAAHREWGPGLQEDGFGLLASDDVESNIGFAEWVGRLESDTYTTYRWIIDDDRVVGGIAFRLPGHPDIAGAGHIGFGIRPSARRQGFASAALRSMLDVSREQGLDEVQLVCAANNSASTKTIEGAGGVMEGAVDTALGRARRYSIVL